MHVCRRAFQEHECACFYVYHLVYVWGGVCVMGGYVYRLVCGCNEHVAGVGALCACAALDQQALAREREQKLQLLE